VDINGNIYKGFNSSVILSVNKGTISSLTTPNFVNGVLTEFYVTIPMPNTGIQITVISPDGKKSVSNQFDVITTVILTIRKTTFTVNGFSNTLDSPPVIKNSRTLLPIRAVIEALGGTVGWDATEKKVTVTLGSTTIELWIGKNTARVNGMNKPIDSSNPKVVPEIINGMTMLPLRFVTENLGCQLQWDPNTQTITITYQG
jgi:hypothetical protein